MKKILLVCLCLAMFSLQAQDQTAFKNETVEFLKLTGAGAAFESAIFQIGMMVPEANKEAFTKEANGTLAGLYDKMAGIYMAEFTQNEIKQLVSFYKTDLGEKLAEKQLSLMQTAMAHGQAWGLEVQAIAQKHSK
ncbi:DUF2059 domain-containing protein [Mariniflexile ostreae]|uniref:DUF2059 domain-containing protein n=1 Tax=Mariniflexile ostreae TaxID=1520892 RepID=A0ABV5F708_9FLAO